MFDYASSSDYIEIDGNEVVIQNVKLTKTCYDDMTGQVIGTAMAKMLTFDTSDTSVAIEGKTFVYHALTVNADGDGENTILGTFIVYKASVRPTDGIISVSAFDLMFKGNVEYVSSLNYSGTVTMTDVLNDACAQAGIALAAETSIVNGAFHVSETPFLVGQTCCEVFAAVAEANGAVAMIVDDMLTFKTLDITAAAIAEVIPEQYESIVVQNAYPAVTKVTMRDTLTGESTSVGTGTGELIFKDNPFGSNSTARTALLTNILTVVSGFTYYVYTAKGIGDPRLECGDRVRVFDADGNEYETFMLSMSYISTGQEKSKSSVISAKAIPQTAITNLAQRTTQIERQTKKAYNTALNAQTSANGKNTVYYSATEPTGGVYGDGDIWFDTANGNKVNVYQGGAWTAVQYGTAAFSVGAITAESGIIGSIDAAKITTGEMSASRIKGDSLVLGGNANEDGYQIIKNASGNDSIVIDNEGMSFYDAIGAVAVRLNTTTANATITVGAGKAFTSIQAAVNSIPYFVNHTITLSIDAGDYNETVIIQNRAGYGLIQLIGNGGDFSVNTLTIKRMACRCFVQHCISDTYYVTDTQYAGFSYANSTAVTDNGYFISHSNVSMDECVVSNKTNIAIIGDGSNVFVMNSSGTNNLFGYMNSGGSFEVDGGALTATTLYSGLITIDGHVMLGAGELARQTSGTWTPTIGASSGTLTTKAVIYATYQKTGKLIFVNFAVSTANIGTGTGALTVTLPFTPANVCTIQGREHGITGTQIQGVSSGATLLITTYNNASPLGNGRVYYMTGTFDIA